MNTQSLKIIAVFGYLFLFTATGTAQAAPVDSAHLHNLFQDIDAKTYTIDFLGWSEVKPDGCEVEVVDSFPSGTEKIFATFEFDETVSEGDSVNVIWYQDDESVTTDSYDVTEDSTCAWFSLFMKKGVPLEDGDYRIELILGKTVIGEGETQVGGEVARKNKQEDYREETIVWTDEVDQKNCPVNTVDGYPSGTEDIKADVPNALDIFEEGETYDHIWYVDDEETIHNKMTYKGWPCFLYDLNNGDEPLWDAVYRIEVYNDEEMILQAETEVGGDGQIPVDEGVVLQGTLKDADTGKAIKGGAVTLLNPGVSFDDWLSNDMPENDVYTMTESDKKGVWRLEDPLERGETYPIVATGKGYKTASGEVEVSKKADEVIEMDIQLEAK